MIMGDMTRVVAEWRLAKPFRLRLPAMVERRASDVAVAEADCLLRNHGF